MLYDAWHAAGELDYFTEWVLCERALCMCGCNCACFMLRTVVWHDGTGLRARALVAMENVTILLTFRCEPNLSIVVITMLLGLLSLLWA